MTPSTPALSAWAEGQRPPHPESRRSKHLARLGGLMAILPMIGYLAWRILDTLPDSGLNRVVGISLLTFETVPLLPLLIRFITLWDLDNPVPPRAGPDERYGLPIVFIPTYNEPLEVLAPTIIASCQIQPLHETWVLDDGKRAWVRELCEQYGARYVTRPDNAHAKAGNINHALGLLGCEGNPAEYIAILDCDHVPLPGFLHQMLGWFDDPQVALVQAPQEYYNYGSFDSDDFAGDQGVFFHVLMVARDAKRSDPFWCGSTSIVRRAALEQIGGVATDTVTEDLHSSLKLLRLGWRIKYHHQTLAVGLAPETPDQFLVQRRRWALGCMQVLVKERLWWPKKWLTWRNYSEYFWTAIWWFEGAITLAGLLLPAMILVCGIEASTADFRTYVVLFVSITVVRFLGAFFVYRRYIRFRHALELRVMRIPIGIACAWWFFTRRQLKFEVTPKGGGGDRQVARVPGLLTLVAVILGLLIAYGVLTLVMPVPWPSSRIATLTGGIWLVYGEVLLLMGMARIRSGAYASSRRLAHRFHARADVRVDGHLGFLNDVSLTGVSVTFRGTVPDSEHAVVQLPGAPRLRLRRVIARDAMVAYTVDPTDYAAIRALALWIFHTPSGAVEALPEGVPAAAVISDKPKDAEPEPPLPVTVRRDAQGLRGLGAVLCLLAALGVSAVPGAFVGVDVLLVVSAYLVAVRVLEEHRERGRVAIRAFYGRKLLRLLPALVAFGGGVAGYLAWQGEPATVEPASFEYLAELAVGAEFWLVWLLPMILLLRATPHQVLLRVLLCMIALGVVVAVRLTADPAAEALLNPGARAYEPLIGVFAAYLAIRWRSLPFEVLWLGGALGVAAILWAALTFDGTDYPGWRALVPAAGTALFLVSGVTKRRGANLLLASPLVRWLGPLALGIYLWSVPVARYGPERLPAEWSLLDRQVALAGVTLLLALLSYWLVERPFLRYRRGRSRVGRPGRQERSRLEQEANAILVEAAAQQRHGDDDPRTTANV